MTSPSVTLQRIEQGLALVDQIRSSTTLLLSEIQKKDSSGKIVPADREFLKQIVVGVNEDITSLSSLAPDLQPHLIMAPSWATPSWNPIVGLSQLEAPPVDVESPAGPAKKDSGPAKRSSSTVFDSLFPSLRSDYKRSRTDNVLSLLETYVKELSSSSGFLVTIMRGSQDEVVGLELTSPEFLAFIELHENITTKQAELRSVSIVSPDEDKKLREGSAFQNYQAITFVAQRVLDSLAKEYAPGEQIERFIRWLGFYKQTPLYSTACHHCQKYLRADNQYGMLVPSVRTLQEGLPLHLSCGDVL